MGYDKWKTQQKEVSMISVLEDWFAAQNWLTPVPTSGSSLPDKLYYCRFESQRVKKKSSDEHKLATPARKRPKRKTTTSRIIQEETGLSRPPAIATSTFSINAPATTASTYTQNTVQLTPNTDSRVQAMASSPSDDENHRAVMGGAGALAAFAAKAMVASNAQMAADKAGDPFGETLDSAVTTKFARGTIEDDINSTEPLDPTQLVGTLKLDGITSCVIEEDDNAVRIFGGSVIGKHTREIMPIREWFKMVVLYTPRLFSYKVSTCNISVICCDGHITRVRVRFHLERFAVVCHLHRI